MINASPVDFFPINATYIGTAAATTIDLSLTAITSSCEWYEAASVSGTWTPASDPSGTWTEQTPC